MKEWEFLLFASRYTTPCGRATRRDSDCSENKLFMLMTTDRIENDFLNSIQLHHLVLQYPKNGIFLLGFHLHQSS